MPTHVNIKQKTDTGENEGATVDNQTSNRSGLKRGRKRGKRAKEKKVPVPAYLFSTFDRETKAYFTPKKEPLSPVNTPEFYNDDDIFDDQSAGGKIDDDAPLTPAVDPFLQQSEVDMKVLGKFIGTQPSDELIKTILQLAVPGKAAIH